MRFTFLKDHRVAKHQFHAGEIIPFDDNAPIVKALVAGKVIRPTTKKELSEKQAATAPVDKPAK